MNGVGEHHRGGKRERIRPKAFREQSEKKDAITELNQFEKQSLLEDFANIHQKKKRNPRAATKIRPTQTTTARKVEKGGEDGGARWQEGGRDETKKLLSAF